MGEYTAKYPSDIAVVGLACRFPRGASNATKFWDLLYHKRSAFTKTPKSRYNTDAFHHPSDKLNTLSALGGHFLEDDVTAFDAPFFNITTQEALAMDPTARMLLEVTYEALENGGFPIEDLVGSATSCYVGCFTRDFHEMLMRDAEMAPRYAGTGTGFSLLSNRISWFYDLRGPSLTLDTACSSSLVGLHLACQSLRTGESKMALVCGANLILSPDLALWLGNLYMTSKDGLSRSFAEEVTGYGRGEGIASLVLKPLEQALSDGDTIRAVIRGTGVNQDGHTAGITLPNSEAQAALIRSTYLAAGLSLLDTTYFEAHGTGTAVGDPLELGAAAQTLSMGRPNNEHLIVGSVKSNIGHLEGAAGLAGVIKCILMLESRTILPNIHFEKPNKRIPFHQWNISIPTEVSPWPKDRPLRASVNSFGYGGTNAHVIVDNAEEFLALNCPNWNGSVGNQQLERKGSSIRLYVFSARDETALRRMLDEQRQYLERQSEAKVAEGNESFLERFSCTLSNRRSRFSWKAFVTASALLDLRHALNSATVKLIRTSSSPRLAFVFTGQGAQWAQMGVELLSYPVFFASVTNADLFLKSQHGSSWSVLAELQKSAQDSQLHMGELSQPICTILQVALIELLQSWNIKPTAVVGHSSGEIAAAVCYGALSREDAWTIAYFRGQVCAELRTISPDTKGAMMAAGLSRDSAENYIKIVKNGKITVACVNSPSSVTISGDEAGIDELYEMFTSDAIFCRKLKVDNAYHSHHMIKVAERYMDLIRSISPKDSASTTVLKFVSSVTGTSLKHEDLGPEYWVENLVSPVLFSDAVSTLLTDTSPRRRRGASVQAAFDDLLEIGPHGALKGPLRQILQHHGLESVRYHSILTRQEDSIKTALTTAGELYVHGTPVSITAANGVQSKLKPLTDLPPYPWNHSFKYWSESRVSRNYRFRKHPRHDLLGARVPDCTEQEPRWRNIIRVNEQPWVRDHVVQSNILYPASGTIAMVLQAVREIADPEQAIDSIKFEDVHLTKAIVIPDNGSGIEVVLQMRQKGEILNSTRSQKWEFSVYSCQENEELDKKSSGIVSITYESESKNLLMQGKNLVNEALRQEYIDIKELCTQCIKSQDFYNTVKIAGLQYGPLFQGVTELFTGPGCCWNTISIPDTRKSMPSFEESHHLIHPTTLDAIFHSMFAALGDGSMVFPSAAIPISFDSLRFSMSLPSGAGSQFSGFCRVKNEKSHDLVADIYMSDVEWNEPKIQIRGIHCRELPASNSLDMSKRAPKTPFGSLLWKPDVDLMTKDLLTRYVAEMSASLENSPSHIAIEHKSKTSASGEYVTALEKEISIIIDLITHKNPNLSILHIGGTLTSTTALLSQLCVGPDNTPRFAGYTSATTDSDILDKATELYKEQNRAINFQLLDTKSGLECFESSSFDVVISTGSYGSTEDETASLQEICRLLRLGGKALMPNTLQIEESGEVSRSSMFKGKVKCFPSSEEPNLAHDGRNVITNMFKIKQLNHVSLLLNQNLDTMKTQNMDNLVHIIEPRNLSEKTIAICENLIVVLTSANISPRRIRWPVEPSQVKGAAIISLLEIEDAFFTDISPEDFDSMKDIMLHSSKLWWIALGDDPMKQTAIGYLRVLRNENPNLYLNYLLLEDKPNDSFSGLVDTILRVFSATNTDREFMEIDGNICINRWMADDGISRLNAIDNERDHLEYVTVGEISKGLKLIDQFPSIYFDIDDDAHTELAPNEVEIEVKAFGIGDLENSVKEFSGVVKAVGQNCFRVKVGERVCGVTLGTLSTIVRVKESMCHTLPDEVTFLDAARWPLTIGTAYQALINIAEVQKDKTVLIQGACNAAGLVCVQIAMEQGATVFATVDTEEHLSFFEGISLSSGHVFQDSDPELAAGILALTRGRGFDVIFNNKATGEKLQQLWQCVAHGGILVDANPTNTTTKVSLDIQQLQKGATYSVVNLARSIMGNQDILVDVLNGIETTLYKTLSHIPRYPKKFSISNLEDAFSYLYGKDAPGKVFVSIEQQDQIAITPKARKPLHLNSNATYLIAGGLGGLGRSLIRLLALKGARNIAIISRSGPASVAAKPLIEEMAPQGVSIRMYACDVSDMPGLAAVIHQCAAEMPPIRGVIQSAAVLEDSIYDNMTHDQWQKAIRPKVQGSWNLHHLLPTNLDFFVMLSSIAGIVGNRGQANYAAGNTFQDALAYYRRKKGLTAVSIDLGLMVGIGLIAERGGETNLKKWEAVGIDETGFHALMTAAMAGYYGYAKLPTQVICGLPTGGILDHEKLDRPFYYNDDRFQTLEKMGKSSARAEDKASDNTPSLATRLSTCGSTDEAAKLVNGALCEHLAKGLQTAAENIDSSKPLHYYGVDSLMAVEIRSWVLTNLKADISLFDVLGSTSVATLVNKIVGGLKIVHK
ncbi:putative polyketide synthase [Xylogone sp. PMI_703]|nr:putative polyketide synthase [Xylogone sp. PMI_703]